MREKVMVCQVLFVESSELEPEKAAKSGLESHREGTLEAGPFTRPCGSPSGGKLRTLKVGGGWRQVQAGSSRAVMGELRPEG